MSAPWWGLATVAVQQKLARATATVPATMPLLYVEVIKRCNLRCQMCAFPSHYPDRGVLLSTDELLQIMRDARELQTRIVSFGGGEPMLRDDILELVQAARENGQALHINTNGTRIDEAVARRLSRADHLHLALSLDHIDAGPNDAIRGRGVRASVQRANDLLRAFAPAVRRSMNVTVGAHSLGSLERTVERAFEWGMVGVKFQPVHHNLGHRYGPGDTPQEMAVTPATARQLGDEVRAAALVAKDLGMATSSDAYVDGMQPYWRGQAQLKCYAGYLYGNIDPYGFLGPCYDHMQPLNVREIGIVAAWRSERMQRMRAAVRGCSNVCWNNGNAEPSLRMSARKVLAQPDQLFRDIALNLGV